MKNHLTQASGRLRGFLAILLLIISLPVLPSSAEDAAQPVARYITSQCKFRLSCNRQERDSLFDNSYRTFWQGTKNCWIEIETSPDDPCYGLYIKWAEKLVDYTIEVPDGENWRVVAHSPEDKYYHQYLPIDGLTHFRIHSTAAEPYMCINEIHVLSAGEIPPDVQIWQPFEGKADLMVLVAHPDDELLYMGGIIPYYRGQIGKKVIVCYIASMPARRKSELLDGLWLCGVREYPETPPFSFPDKYSSSLKAALGYWREEKLLSHITSLLRKYRPDVVVTHDLKGEYGHGAHRACAYALTKCVTQAADANFEPKSLSEYGVWQVKKLYIHLYKENELIMDWRQPLDAFDGQTAFDVASAAFLKHRSQQGTYVVRDSGHDDNRRFGLYFTTVGLDENKNDLFENIE